MITTAANPAPVLLQMQDVQFAWKTSGADTPPARLHIPAFALDAGERVFVHGPSGCGKSTLLGLCSGVLAPDRGRIELLGQVLNLLKPSQRDQFRVDHLGIIFQQFNLIPYLDLIGNVMLPCQFSKQRMQAACASTGSDRIKLSIAQQAGQRLLLQLGINEASWKKPAGSLSIGQQQRVAAARALIGTPQLIIADEPTSALDEMHQQNFMECLISQCQTSNASLIFVSHDRRLAGHFGRQVDCQQWQVVT